MRSQPDHDEGVDGRAVLGDGQVKDMVKAASSSVPSPIEPASGSGTESHHIPRVLPPKGTRSSSEDQISESLSHSPTLGPAPPSHIVDAQPPALAEAAVWDWQAPTAYQYSEASNSVVTGLYEPQGELLLQDRGGLANGRANEFNIPDPVRSSNVDHRRLSTNPLEAALAGHSVPGVDGVSAGAKRKSAPDLYQTPAKRPTLGRTDSEQIGVYVNSQFGRTTFDPDRRTLPATHPSGSTPAMVLPARKVFPIQIGDKLFRLSGASISSDDLAPSYFSQFFEEQLRQSSSSSKSSASDASSVRTLYIDRDPSTFCDISLHLQGYHIEPRDGAHFVKLFADAQFFSLPRLTSQLFTSPIYTTIGSVPFQIPRDLFSSSPGNEPNYFTLGFQIFFTTPSDIFPGLSQRNLLRPPSLLPPSVPNRDAEVFTDLLRMLKGYDVEIKSDQHRQSLLRDARYFNFRGLEQKLVKHRVSYNSTRELEEIEIRLEDIRQSGISLVTNQDKVSSDEEEVFCGDVYYARPYVDDHPRALIVELGGEDGAEVILDAKSRIGAIGFERDTAARMRKLAAIVNEKAGLGVRCAQDDKTDGTEKCKPFGLQCELGCDADLVVDGKRWNVAGEGDDTRMDIEDKDREVLLVIKKSQWRVKIGSLDTTKISLEAVKVQAYSRQRAMIESRSFL